MQIYLHEFECIECEETLLLEMDKEPELCPYCQGCIDYSNGNIEVVAKYTPRKYKSNANV